MRPILFLLIILNINCRHNNFKEQDLNGKLVKELKTEIIRYFNKVIDHNMEGLVQMINLSPEKQEELRAHRIIKENKVKLINRIETLIKELTISNFEKQQLLICLKEEGKDKECTDRMIVLMKPITSFLYDAGQSVFSDINMVVFENKWYQEGVSELENCSKYKEGKFYYFLPESQSDTVNIIRFLNKQIDIYKGQEVETYLSWTSNCTYEYTIPGIGKGKTEILGEFQGGYLFFNSQEGMDKVVEKSFGKVYIKNK